MVPQPSLYFLVPSWVGAMGVTGVTDGHGTRPTAGVGSGGHAGADALAVVVAGTGQADRQPWGGWSGRQQTQQRNTDMSTPCAGRRRGGGVDEVLSDSFLYLFTTP